MKSILLTAACLVALAFPAFADEVPKKISVTSVVYVHADCEDPDKTGARCKFLLKQDALETILPGGVEMSEIMEMNPNLKNFLDAEGNLPALHIIKVG